MYPLPARERIDAGTVPLSELNSSIKSLHKQNTDHDVMCACVLCVALMKVRNAIQTSYEFDYTVHYKHGLAQKYSRKGWHRAE